MARLATHGLEAGALASGDTRTGGLEGVVKAPLDQTFVSYTDANDVLTFVVPAS